MKNIYEYVGKKCMYLSMFAFLVLFGVAVYFILNKTSYDNSQQKLLANEIRVRAGLVDLNGNLKELKNNVNFFPGVSDICKNYVGDNPRAFNCLVFYLDVSEFSWNKNDEVFLKKSLSTACKSEKFCEKNDLKLIELFFVDKGDAESKLIAFGAKNFRLVEKTSYLVENDSWN